MVAPALPSASILLIRDGSNGLEVLMMERARTMKFAPGAFVFPGGKVDKSDFNSFFWRAYTNHLGPTDDLAFKVAALRELYEEVSIFNGDSILSPCQMHHEGFKAFIKRIDGWLDTQNMVPFAHWVTPTHLPRRFDTHFYLTPVLHDQTGIEDGNEAISMRWVRPKNMLKQWDRHKIPLMFPTRLNLIKLARYNTVYNAMQATKRATVIKVLPTVDMIAGKPKVRISASCGYGVTEASERELQAESKKPAEI